jgi:hypothetical protein
MGPHRDPRLNMHQLEMTTLGHPLLALVRVVDLDLEVCVGLPGLVDAVPGRELGVRREGWAGDVMREESRIGVDMTEGDDVVLANNAAATGIGDLLGRFDDPVIVRVIKGVSRDLLSCSS